MEIDIGNVLGSSWLVPLFVIGSWALVKFLDGKFITMADFNAYKEARGEEEKEYREFVNKELEDKQNYLKAIDKKANDNGKEVARLEGKLDK